MTGHEAILKLRRSGKAPIGVWVDDFPAKHVSDGRSVSLAPGDVPELLDWRFVARLTVHVSGDDLERVRRIAAACGQYARRVVASVFAPALDWRGERCMRVVQVLDSEGVFTWPR